ncbi:CoA-binding protein [Noviherbaspirillum aridicola]|uniref:CoA-binding domain-containing protein n=1 Tax=Noviherbaspirillum aridicola TaxID=2849687 RepID=A0ABQ4QBM2_9BURK|nr:CoA-binding protein [Noviherbaspirillum aridicola]GIZ54079.1 hypothetical protein NCCP691_40930 [Noviherbaspirillum aridicola]
MHTDEDSLIGDMLRGGSNLAVVGLSPDPGRASHEVAAYMQQQGWRIIPVNPVCAGRKILGEHCHASLADAAKALAAEGGRIDIVDCFRRPEHMPGIVAEAIAAGARHVWMQLGVSHPQAQAAAEQAGLGVVADRCIKIEHAARER